MPLLPTDYGARCKNILTSGPISYLAWRYKKNKLADPTFLFKCGLVASRLCAWYQVESTALLMLMSFERATKVWA